MWPKSYALFTMIVWILWGCNNATSYDTSTKLEFDQSTPENAVKQLIKLVERDKFSGVKEIFSDSAVDDFKTLENHKLIISLNVRGLRLDEVQLNVERDGRTAVVKPNKKLSSLLRTEELQLALEGNQWKIVDANFRF